MADPLSITASVVGIAGFAFQIGSISIKLKNFLHDVKHAPEHVKESLEEIGTISKILEEIGTQVERDDVPEVSGTTAKKCLDLCQQGVGALETAVKDIEASLKKNKYRGGIKAVLKERDIAKLYMKLDRAKSYLQLSIDMYCRALDRHPNEFQRKSFELQEKTLNLQEESNDLIHEVNRCSWTTSLKQDELLQVQHRSFQLQEVGIQQHNKSHQLQEQILVGQSSSLELHQQVVVLNQQGYESQKNISKRLHALEKSLSRTSTELTYYRMASTKQETIVFQASRIAYELLMALASGCRVTHISSGHKPKLLVLPMENRPRSGDYYGLSRPTNMLENFGA